MDAPDTLSYSVAPGDLRTINHRLERISQTIQHLRQKIECNVQTTSSHCGEAEKEDGNNLVGEEDTRDDPAFLESELRRNQTEFKQAKHDKMKLLNDLDTLTVKPRVASIYLPQGSREDTSGDPGLRGIINAIDGSFSFIQVSKLETDMGTYPEVVIRGKDVRKITWHGLTKKDHESLKTQQQEHTY